MAKRNKITHCTGRTEVHFVGVHQQDYALCGHDLDGDYKYDHATETEEKVTCKDCIAIVKYCKQIKKSEYVNQ